LGGVQRNVTFLIIDLGQGPGNHVILVLIGDDHVLDAAGVVDHDVFDLAVGPPSPSRTLDPMTVVIVLIWVVAVPVGDRTVVVVVSR